MIVGDLKIKSIAFLPSKTDSILIVDSDAVLSHPISLQRLQTIRWWRREVAKLFRAVDLNQPPKRDSRDGLKSSHAPLTENRFGIAIAKGADQTNIILRITSNVFQALTGELLTREPRSVGST